MDEKELSRGHNWKMYANRVDNFGFERGFHNGPKCEVCGYGYCHHCEDGPQVDCSGERVTHTKADYSDDKLNPFTVAFDARLRSSLGLRPTMPKQKEGEDGNV